jgi:hypothetical protein
VTPNQPESEAPRRELERRFGIPPDRFCGLDAATMSRAIIAHDCGPLRPGEAVGYNPIGSTETRLGWLRQAFGRDVNAEHLRLCVQFFHGRISEALPLDWMLPNDDFDRQIVEGLARLYPDLTPEARSVIAGKTSYSHAR